MSFVQVFFFENNTKKQFFIQFGFIDFACEENKKIFFHNSEIEAGFELRAGDEVEFYAQYNPKSGKPCASKLRRIK